MHTSSNETRKMIHRLRSYFQIICWDNRSMQIYIYLLCLLASDIQYFAKSNKQKTTRFNCIFLCVFIGSSNIWHNKQHGYHQYHRHTSRTLILLLLSIVIFYVRMNELYHQRRIAPTFFRKNYKFFQSVRKNTKIIWRCNTED